MKKNWLFIGVATLMSLVSCDDGKNEYNQSFVVSPISLVTSVADGTTTVSKGSYGFQTEAYSQLGSITASEITVGGASMAFQTGELQFTSLTGFEAIFKNVETTTSGSTSYDLHNGNFMITPNYYFPGLINIESPYNPVPGYTFPMALVASYSLGNEYTVKTFPKNTFFMGSTTTSYTFQGVPDNFKTDDIMYGLILNLDDNTATLIMYNAKFSSVPQEPLKTQINIEGLSVEYTNGNIVAKGTDIIPLLPEAGGFTPNENYIFNNIEFMTTSNDLTQARITYTVAGRYTGNFVGKYVIDMNNNN